MKDTSYNLVMAALFNGRKGQRPPVGNPTSIVCHGLMDACGVPFPAAHPNANAMAELALAGHEVLGFDTVMPEYSVHQESQALGCTVDWGDRDNMTMEKALDLIRPLLKGDRSFSGRIVIGTVKGDLHDVGKNLVSMMLEGAGFQVTDLGVSINVQTVIDKVQELNA